MRSRGIRADRPRLTGSPLEDLQDQEFLQYVHPDEPFAGRALTAAYLPARGSFYSIGHGLDATEAAALNAAVQTLQLNLGRMVV